MTQDVFAHLREWGVATVYEAHGRRGLTECDWIQLLPGSRAAGPARTVLCGQDDNLMVHAAIERIQPGEIVVIAMPEARPVALVGELLAIQVKMRGAAAVLVDGAVRDVVALRQLGLPIWSRSIRARGATKAIPGALDVRVEVAGAAIEPGDILVLDADGAVCVPLAHLAEVAKACEAREAKEASLRRRLLAGERTFDIHGLHLPGAGEGRKE